MLCYALAKGRGFSCIVVFLLIAVNTFAQSQPEPKPDATISGQVRWQEKGIPDCEVFIWPGWSADVPQFAIPIKTDRDGRFRRSVPAGNYQVWVLARAFYVVVDGQLSLQPKRFTLDAGQVMDDIKFDLQRGGVVTGKVILNDRPVIDLNVNLLPAKATERPIGSTTPTWDKTLTDDRGVYRFYGVPPGHYKVVAGDQPAISSLQRRMPLPRTFFPDQSEEAKAKTIVVESEKEVTDVDIKMSPPVPMFTIRGVVVDGQTGAPVSNTRVALQIHSASQMLRGRIDNNYSNQKGEFLIENVPPGRYSLFSDSELSGSGEDHFGHSEEFDITDHDIEGFVFKTSLTSSVAGSVVIEGQSAAESMAQLKSLRFFVMSTPKTPETIAVKMFQVQPDGSFMVHGLTPGTLKFQFALSSGEAEPPLRIIRVERMGRSDPIEIMSGDNLSGLKLVLTEARSSLRGKIQFADGSIYPQLSGSAVLYVDKQSEAGEMSIHRATS
jgi:hypothetical protein